MGIDHEATEGVVYVPSSALPDTHAYTDLGSFTVDGETFTVRRRDDDGSLHYDWISGPNDGYGFSVFCGAGPIGDDRHSADVREFLSAIDPETGYFYDRGNRVEPMCEGAIPLKIRSGRGLEDYAELVEIWRSAVRATHDFLEESDFTRIESHLASDYFPAVTLTVAEKSGQQLGFAGVLDGALEMLFVSDAARGEGIGSALLAEVIKNQAVSKVDVNEQNSGARGFYLSRGFVQVGRSELDGDGRPYPIIHMELQTTS